MSKIVVMAGLPASGKSTTCQQLMTEYGNAVRINRDLLRTMLHFDVWSGKKENMTKEATRAIAKAMLSRSDVGVLFVDDTNLHPGTVENWRQVAREMEAGFEMVRLDTPVEECLRRDALRDKPVGRHVIVGMALQYGLYPKPAKGFVLCDIDGTLADCSHRRHLVQQTPKDWDGFHAELDKDPPRIEVREQVAAFMRDGYEVIFVSGRPDTYRRATELWLLGRCAFGTYDHGKARWPYTALFMRRGGDHRPDVEVKGEMLRTYWPDCSLIHCVIDDRPSVIREVWQAAGLTVIDVGTGEEF